MSEIKERVLSIAKIKGISKTDFFKDLGLSYANFKGVQKASALSSDAMVVILSRHPDINPAWLVTGEGEMFRDGSIIARDNITPYVETTKTDYEVIAALKLVISSQEKTIQSLERQVSFLEEELAKGKINN